MWFKFIEIGFELTSRLRGLRLLLIAGLGFTFPLLVLGQYGRFILPFFSRLLIFWIIVCLATWLFESVKSSGNPVSVFSALALIFGVIHRLALFSADLSTYPFSLGWSEASRYYYASLFFSQQIYGVSVPPSVLHPTRYFMQSLPYLIPGTGLFAHRLWQVFIWVVMTASVGYVMVRRLRLDSRWERYLFILWIFLFLFQGPVWYHLLVIVVVTLWGARIERPWLTLGVVFLASLWAGVSRVNWIPVPSMLAAMLYLIERKKGDRGVLSYVAWPSLWFIGGIAAGFTSQWFYILVSGNEAGQFGSSFDSPLLWYRLFPSGTYPLGVLPGIVLASLPLVLLIFYRLQSLLNRDQVIRLVGIIAILIALFGGGILVSVKIGGGSNLHNLDAYLVAIMILGIYVGMDHWKPASSSAGTEESYPPILLLAIIWMPIFFALGMGKPLRIFDLDQAERSLVQIRSIIEPVGANGGEVLLISQRHLLTFDVIKDIDLSPEYETVFLMEMAMARNRDYLDQFHSDLMNHRFDLVVVDSLSTEIQTRDHNFAEENNAWVEEISYPLLCHYDVVDTLSNPPLQFLIPSLGNKSCSQ
jgi:hypothetical protein